MNSNQYNIPNIDTEDIIRNKCGIDPLEIQSQIDQVGRAIANVKSTNQLYDLLLSNQFYSQISNVTNMIRSIKLDTIRCLRDDNKEEICRNVGALDLQFSTDDLDKINLLLDKYSGLLRNIRSWLFDYMHELYQYCGRDQAKLDKFRQIMNKIGSLFTNNEATSTTLTHDNNETKWRSVAICLIIILVVLIVIYFVYIKK